MTEIVFDGKIGAPGGEIQEQTRKHGGKAVFLLQIFGRNVREFYSGEPYD